MEKIDKLYEKVVGDKIVKKDFEDVLKNLKSKLKVGYVNGYVSELGGKDRASLMLSISLDKKKDWSGGYIENSKYGKFSIGSDGKIIKSHNLFISKGNNDYKIQIDNKTKGFYILKLKSENSNIIEKIIL